MHRLKFESPAVPICLSIIVFECYSIPELGNQIRIYDYSINGETLFPVLDN